MFFGKYCIAIVISLLFDGLDEVSTERRSTCIEALNALVPQVDQMVVCSRLVEYQAMQPLTFDNALVLQPISRADALAVLTKEGRATAGIREAIKRDPMFAELLTTPLMLHVTMLAFAGQTAVSIKGRNPDELRNQLWEVYIQRMFTQRTLRTHTHPQARKWLSWLAGKMKKDDETTFFVEYLQPSLLSGMKWLYRSILILSIVIFLVILLILFFLVLYKTIVSSLYHYKYYPDFVYKVFKEF